MSLSTIQDYLKMVCLEDVLVLLVPDYVLITNPDVVEGSLDNGN